MTAPRTPSKAIGPFFIRPARGPACTACGRAMTAGVTVGRQGVDAVLHCDGCGRWGVYCECQPVEGYIGLRRA